MSPYALFCMRKGFIKKSSECALHWGVGFELHSVLNTDAFF